MLDVWATDKTGHAFGRLAGEQFHGPEQVQSAGLGSGLRIMRVGVFLGVSARAHDACGW